MVTMVQVHPTFIFSSVLLSEKTLMKGAERFRWGEVLLYV